MRQFGKVEIPQSAFLAALKILSLAPRYKSPLTRLVMGVSDA
ncbi:hypothetical protein JGUZn3_11560 [Entomobacter blattae]|uniref:Uncharacterized protein n=2 Tax=Entomobacter blattae TaxID=2762277 RepID=A0A7H1NRH2_9PROT|nr:hypothetical protein JGUZn3_11560 [Entomobacter blattae]